MNDAGGEVELITSFITYSGSFFMILDASKSYKL
jgi:hypothetical protein